MLNCIHIYIYKRDHVIVCLIEEYVSSIFSEFRQSFANMPTTLYDSRIPIRNKGKITTKHLPFISANQQHNG